MAYVHNELEKNDQRKIKFKSIHHHHPLTSSSPQLVVKRLLHSQTISGWTAKVLFFRRCVLAPWSWRRGFATLCELFLDDATIHPFYCFLHDAGMFAFFKLQQKQLYICTNSFLSRVLKTPIVLPTMACSRTKGFPKSLLLPKPMSLKLNTRSRGLDAIWLAVRNRGSSVGGPGWKRMLRGATEWCTHPVWWNR